MSSKRVHQLSPALSIYQKYENNQLGLEDLRRDDLHFKMKTGADILIEENGIHVQNPHKFSVKHIYDWSSREVENFELVLENYTSYYAGIDNKYSHEILPTFKQFFGADQPETINLTDPDEILKYCKGRLKILRHDSSFEAYNEIVHRRQNIFDILYYKLNKNIEDLVLKLYTNDLSITNTVTLLQSMFETHENSEGLQTYAHKQRQYSIGEIIELLQDPKLNTLEKTSRPLLLSGTSGNRTIGEDTYLEWSGLQVFDIDLKFSSAFVEKYGDDASQCRDILFEKLKHYPWLIGIALSHSGRALHIYTKVSRMHHIFSEDEANIKNQKYWYRMSYIQKHAAIAYVLDKHCGIHDIYLTAKHENGKKREKIIDSSLAKPSQGIALNHDPNAKWSTNFIDMYPAVFYHIPPDKDIAPEEWLLKPELLVQYSEWFYENAVNDETNIEITKSTGAIEIQVSSETEIDGIKQIDISQLAKGDKYTTRWRICNTIMYGFGDNEYARKLCHHILQSAETKTTGMINSFIRSAVINNKEADAFTIKQLRRLGVQISLTEESSAAISDDALIQIKYLLSENDYNFNFTSPNINIELKDTEYLGMRMDSMLSSMKDFMINIIESAPNTGKTEFFKRLAKTHSVCLVIPFTSTIESKIVNDESIRELFDVYYGDISVRDVKKGRSVVMTFDKFSMLPKSKYSLFDFMAIDESHLLFTSTYRLPVVSQTIENLRTYLIDDLKAERSSLSQVLSVQNLMSFIPVQQHIARQNTKVILMTGTLTGEIDYFKHYGLLNYIKVHKKHPHQKKLDITICKTSSTRDILIFKEIAEQLKAGGKVIHPTNKGDAYSKKVVDCVEWILGRKIKAEYYKRANYDDQFLIDVNKNTTLNDVELLFCSDYLSVGIDINDQHNFKLIFSNDFTAESIEQFNNRLRNTDIHCKIFYDVIDESGLQKANIINVNHIQYTHTDEIRNMIHDERSIALLQKAIHSQGQYYAILGEMFSKYFIQDYRGEIQYIRSAFEIEQFELQYTIISKSLLYIKSAMKSRFNYDVGIEIAEECTEGEIEKFGTIQKDAKNAHDKMKTESFVELVRFLGSPKIYNIVRQNDVTYTKLNEDDALEQFEYNINIEFLQNLKHGTYNIVYHKRHKLVIDKAKRFVKFMRKLYSMETTNEIVQSCIKKNGIINNTELGRYERLMKLIFDDRRNSLSTSTRDILESSYEFVDPNLEKTKIDRFEYEELKSIVRHSIEKHFISITNRTLASQRRQDNVQVLVTKFIDTLFHKRVGVEFVSLSFRKIHKFDSSTVQDAILRDKIFSQILLNKDYDENEVHATHSLLPQHIQHPVAIAT